MTSSAGHRTGYFLAIGATFLSPVPILLHSTQLADVRFIGLLGFGMEINHLLDFGEGVLLDRFFWIQF